MEVRRFLGGLSLVAGLAALSLWLTPSFPVHLLFGLAFGWVLQRAGFCFVSAFREPIMTGGTTLARALLLAIAIATAGFTFVTLITGRTGFIAPAGLNTVIGGLLFGVGMVVSGACVSGTLMRMGDGFVLQWLALIGLLAGSLFGAWSNSSMAAPLFAMSRKVYLPSAIGWGPALVLQAAALIVLWRWAVVRERRCFGPEVGEAANEGIDSGEPWTDGPGEAGEGIVAAPESRTGGALRPLKALLRAATGDWSPVAGAVALAALNTGYFAVAGRPWGITTELTYWAAGLWRLLGGHPEQWIYFVQEGRAIPDGIGILTQPGTGLNLGVVLGAFLASYIAGQLRLRKPRNWRQVVAALGGGFLMGYGSRLSAGCNVGALFSGTASLSLHGWVYFVSLGAGAYVGVRLADVMLYRPAIRTSGAVSDGATGSTTAGTRGLRGAGD